MRLASCACGELIPCAFVGRGPELPHVSKRADGDFGGPSRRPAFGLVGEIALGARCLGRRQIQPFVGLHVILRHAVAAVVEKAEQILPPADCPGHWRRESRELPGHWDCRARPARAATGGQSHSRGGRRRRAPSSLARYRAGPACGRPWPEPGRQGAPAGHRPPMRSPCSCCHASSFRRRRQIVPATAVRCPAFH